MIFRSGVPVTQHCSSSPAAGNHSARVGVRIERVRREPVGARRAADAQVDAPWRDRFQHAKLLGDLERRSSAAASRRRYRCGCAASSRRWRPSGPRARCRRYCRCCGARKPSSGDSPARRKAARARASRESRRFRRAPATRSTGRVRIVSWTAPAPLAIAGGLQLEELGVAPAAAPAAPRGCPRPRSVRRASTRMRSAMRTLEKRCEISTAVLPSLQLLEALEHLELASARRAPRSARRGSGPARRACRRARSRPSATRRRTDRRRCGSACR